MFQNWTRKLGVEDCTNNPDSGMWFHISSTSSTSIAGKCFIVGGIDENSGKNWIDSVDSCKAMKGDDSTATAKLFVPDKLSEKDGKIVAEAIRSGVADGFCKFAGNQDIWINARSPKNQHVWKDSYGNPISYDTSGLNGSSGATQYGYLRLQSNSSALNSNTDGTPKRCYLCAADRNECVAEVNACDTESGATCVNTIGSFKCKCDEGSTLHENGRECVDEDECAQNWRCPEGKCLNSPGSYTCVTTTRTTEDEKITNTGSNASSSKINFCLLIAAIILMVAEI